MKDSGVVQSLHIYEVNRHLLRLSGAVSDAVAGRPSSLPCPHVPVFVLEGDAEELRGFH